MLRLHKLSAKIVGFSLLGVVLLVVAWFSHMYLPSDLPSDASAKAYFAVHRAALDSLAQTVSRDPHIEFVNAQWIAYGSAAQDPAHIDCAKRLREIGAEFLRHSGGLVEIYFWGTGCAICHDSYKGFAYVTNPGGDMPVGSKVSSSLADRALAAGTFARIEDGLYLLPITDHWYLIRNENG
jgi:hypothetical protein